MKTTGKKVSIIRNRKRQSEEVFQQLRYKLRKNNFILTDDSTNQYPLLKGHLRKRNIYQIRIV